MLHRKPNLDPICPVRNSWTSQAFATINHLIKLQLCKKLLKFYIGKNSKNSNFWPDFHQALMNFESIFEFSFLEFSKYQFYHHQTHKSNTRINLITQKRKLVFEILKIFISKIEPSNASNSPNFQNGILSSSNTKSTIQFR